MGYHTMSITYTSWPRQILIRGCMIKDLVLLIMQPLIQIYLSQDRQMFPRIEKGLELIHDRI